MCHLAYPPSSFYISLLLPSGDIHLNAGSSSPAHLLLCTLNTHSMLTPSHITALNNHTDNLQPDVLSITETWTRTTTIPAELIDSTPPGYSLFSAPRTSATRLSKSPSAGGTAFLLKEPANIPNNNNNNNKYITF